MNPIFAWYTLIYTLLYTLILHILCFHNTSDLEHSIAKLVSVQGIFYAICYVKCFKYRPNNNVSMASNKTAHTVPLRIDFLSQKQSTNIFHANTPAKLTTDRANEGTTKGVDRRDSLLVTGNCHPYPVPVFEWLIVRAKKRWGSQKSGSLFLSLCLWLAFRHPHCLLLPLPINGHAHEFLNTSVWVWRRRSKRGRGSRLRCKTGSERDYAKRNCLQVERRQWGGEREQENERKKAISKLTCPGFCQITKAFELKLHFTKHETTHKKKENICTVGRSRCVWAKYRKNSGE